MVLQDSFVDLEDGWTGTGCGAEVVEVVDDGGEEKSKDLKSDSQTWLGRGKVRIGKFGSGRRKHISRPNGLSGGCSTFTATRNEDDQNIT